MSTPTCKQRLTNTLEAACKLIFCFTSYSLLGLTLFFSLPAFLYSDTSSIEYHYTDEYGQRQTASTFAEVPEELRGSVLAVDTSKDGPEKHPNKDQISKFLKALFYYLKLILFWSIAGFLAFLYAIGKLDEWYYRWIEQLKRKRGIEGLYRRKHSATHECYLELVFCLAGKLSRADGQVAQEEITTVEQFIAEHLKLSQEEAQKARRYFRKGRDSQRSFESFLKELQKVFGNHQGLLQLVYSFLESVASANGTISPEEEALLKLAREKLGVSEKYRQRFESFGRESGVQEAYQILNSSPNDSLSTVKKRYRKLVFELHPDRLNAQGMSGEFVRLAQERFLKVQAAYEKIESAKK